MLENTTEVRCGTRTRNMQSVAIAVVADRDGPTCFCSPTIKISGFPPQLDNRSHYNVRVREPLSSVRRVLWSHSTVDFDLDLSAGGLTRTSRLLGHAKLVKRMGILGTPLCEVHNT